MTILLPRRNLKRDLEKIRRFSSRIEDKLHTSDASRIDRLSEEQLEDLGEILRIADHMLVKYEDKRDIYGLLVEFVGMIRHSAAYIDEIDSDIDELILSAEESIALIRDAQAGLAEKADLDRSQ